MRKVLIFGFVLVCVTGLSVLSVMPLERKSLNHVLLARPGHR